MTLAPKKNRHLNLTRPATSMVMLLLINYCPTLTPPFDAYINSLFVICYIFQQGDILATD